jgi:hypothetical protein
MGQAHFVKVRQRVIDRPCSAAMWQKSVALSVRLKSPSDVVANAPRSDTRAHYMSVVQRDHKGSDAMVLTVYSEPCPDNCNAGHPRRHGRRHESTTG